MSVGFAFLTKDPELSQLRMLVEYLRHVSSEFAFAVDDRTDPQTIETIRSWPGAKVETISWRDDFAWARNQSLGMIESDWTAVIDPDELPNWELLKFIKEQSADKGEVPLGWLWWTMEYFGGRNSAGSAEQDWHIRMWRTGRGQFYRRVHELVQLDGQPESFTRGKDRWVRKAPKSGTLIHAKPQTLIPAASELYNRIEKGAGEAPR